MKKTLKKRLALEHNTVRILAELPETKLRNVAGGDINVAGGNINHTGGGGGCSGTTGKQGLITISSFD